MKRRDDSAASGQPGPKFANSKLRQESAAVKPSGRLRREGEPLPPETAGMDEAAPGASATSPASGQVGPKSGKGGKKTAKEARRTDKSKLRAEKSADKLTAAKEKLAAQKPQRRPGPVKTLSRAAGYEAWARVHGKIHEAERENAGVEAAHRAELLYERAERAAVRFVKHRNRTRPARRVRKWERKSIKASADLRFRELVRENPDLKSNPLTRLLQKRRLKTRYRKQAKEAAKKAARKTGEAAVSSVEKIGRAAAAFVKRHPAGMSVALLCFLLLMALQSCAGGALTLGNGLAGAVGGTSYLAEDADIDEAELRYTEWETDLMIEAGNAETSHPGYDEYRYDLAAVGHDPYAMLAYLTAKHDDFTFAAVQGELQGIFGGQYSLTFTQIVEVRSYEDSWTDSEGNSHSETVYYNYYILQTALTARPFGEVIAPLLTAGDERDRYEVYMFLHGNRQYVGSPFDFNWLPYVSSYYGYRVHPISGEKDFHEGVDIALPAGTEIKAGGEGVVTEAGSGGSYGLTLLVDYGDGITARYAHCHALLAGVGQAVSMGDVIALVGNTGNSTGPHLHMEVIKDGRRLNPLYFVDGTVG